jgi:hypothetical protein
MKTNRVTCLLTTALGLAAFSTAGCKDKQLAEAPLPPAKITATTPLPVPEPNPAHSSQVATAANAEAAPVQWNEFKDISYDMRAQCFAGLARLEARVDSQVTELTAKRAAMTSTTDTKDWDFAMKEMSDARAYLTSMGDELNKATPETWAQQKDKVGQAWVRTQEAYGKVKSSTTG